jgi:hypothetical protein
LELGSDQTSSQQDSVTHRRDVQGKAELGVKTEKLH